MFTNPQLIGYIYLERSLLQQGKTATEIAVNLHNLVGNSFNDCHRIVRTESMHYLNDATLQRYRDSGIEEVQVWASHDERTCDVCGAEHEKKYPINRCPVVPFHPNCRCTIIPVVEVEEKETDKGYKLSSSKSMKKSLEYISSGKANLNKRRQNLADRVPKSGDWIILKKGAVDIKDLAYLSAYSHDEYAIWESKASSILAHGSRYHCNVEGKLYDIVKAGNYKIVAHSHVDGGALIPSKDDRKTLIDLGQPRSKIVSITGEILEFGQNPFDDIS